MEEQINLFPTDQNIHEKWICQRTIRLGSNHTINTGDQVIVIERYKDNWLNVDMIVLLHNSKRVETMESFFTKHFYILSKQKKERVLK